MILELQKQILKTEKVKNRIDDDITNKSQALQIDETCANKNYENAVVEDVKTKKCCFLYIKYVACGHHGTQGLRETVVIIVVGSIPAKGT